MRRGVVVIVHRYDDTEESADFGHRNQPGAPGCVGCHRTIAWCGLLVRHGGGAGPNHGPPSVDCGRSPATFCMEDAMERLPLPGGRTPDSGVGHFRVTVELGSRGGERFVALDALVDTGATY